jgi:hypothetical protein
MNNPAIYGMLSALVFFSVTACSDGKARTEQTGAIESQGGDTTADPAGVVRRYYEAIQNGKYDAAYALWEGSGKASGQTLAEFASGFAQTERTTASVGDSVSVEAAAGSQYATVPVTVDATLRGGTHQHFVGTYTLRRAMVDGATPEQRSWRIYSAHLQQH